MLNGTLVGNVAAVSTVKVVTLSSIAAFRTVGVMSGLLLTPRVTVHLLPVTAVTVICSPSIWTSNGPAVGKPAVFATFKGLRVAPRGWLSVAVAAAGPPTGLPNWPPPGGAPPAQLGNPFSPP